MNYIAFVTKGLEEVVKDELQVKLEKLSIIEIGDKRIIFSTTSSIETVCELKTVDDIGLFISKGVLTKNSDQLNSLIHKEVLYEAHAVLSKFRTISNSFSLTVGAVKSAVKTTVILETLSAYLIKEFNWDYTEFDHSNFDIRVFITGKTILFAVRITSESLHKRSYKSDAKPGSLKPTVAAAMVFLATYFKKNVKIIDTFCGSGTILCEAFQFGCEVYGGDIDVESVEIAKRNVQNCGWTGDEEILVSDARRTSWPNAYFDCAISNLPWDKQIQVSSITELYEQSISEYFRVLKPGGVLCVLVTKPELFIKYVKKCKPDVQISSIKIGLLGQNPTIILVNHTNQLLNSYTKLT